MFNRIIVAIDGSRTAARAFDLALDLAATHAATLQAFYVIESSTVFYDVPGYNPSILRDELIEEGKKLGHGALAAMKQRNVTGDVKVGEASTVDDVSELVLRAASEFNADLLVMGTHGRTGIKRLIEGSVAERTLRQATLPVLLVPSAAGPDSEA